MINVLYAVIRGEMGGVERFLDSVISAHSDRANSNQVDPVVLSFREGPWLDEIRARGLPVYVIENARVREPLRCFREVRAIIQRHQIDVVHSSYSWCHALTWPAAFYSRCGTVWFHHGPVGEGRWQGAMALIPADLMLTNSEFMLERLKTTIHCARQLGVVHYGIDANKFAPDLARREAFRKAWKLDDDTCAVGIVGFLDRWKGQDIFLKAAKLLHPEAKRIRMLVIGGPREGATRAECEAYQAELRAYASRNGLDEMVSFTGHVDIRDGALDGLDVFVHASTAPEPLGIVIMEAMAKGKAIIASAEGGPREMITDAVDGLLIEPREPEVLAAAIRRLCANADERIALGSAALDSARTKFTPARAAGKLEDWYARILKK
jgi:glycosyltransferase involved in cell wall biosynthesis